VGEVLRALSARRATLRWILDTHAHGDHLSGATLLHQKTGADVVASVASDARGATRRVGEGDVLALGEVALRVRAAPGVAPDAVVLEGPGVLFTGDTLLVGTIGVRDAPGSDGSALYETMQRIFDPLPDETVVHPGHDDMGRSRTTIKAEKRGNRWLREKDREVFLSRWASDPRVVAKEAAAILAANREGVTERGPDLETLQVHGKPAAGAGPVVTPQGMGGARAGAAASGATVPHGVGDLVLIGGLVVLAGTTVGFLVHPLAHLASGVVGALAVGLGLTVRGSRPRKSGPGLYYTGPQPRTPMR
jgi:glyoxylase-like metal-dependent hydrolase (beta-lactamase superfamily II)